MINRNSRRGLNGVPPEFTTPPPIDFDTEEMRGSMQKILSDNIGEFVVVEFLIGTDRIMRKQGILYFVGTSYVTLYDDDSNNFIVCDIFSIKFVYFYFPGQRPNRNYNLLPSNNNINGNNQR
ncbi:MAG: hypothetical protein HFE39_07460 [Clostridiales bacterium]|nr:hypothetical protein [Clostridiales bacterium]